MRFIDTALRDVQGNRLKNNFVKPDLRLSKQLNKKVWLFSLLAQNEEGFNQEMTRPQFGDRLDELTDTSSIKQNQKEIKALPQEILIALKSYTENGEPLIGKVSKFSTTPNSEMPNVRYKIATTQNNFQVFIPYLLDTEKNYFVSKEEPSANFENKYTNLIYYASNVDREFDTFGNAIGTRLDLISIRDIVKENEDNSISRFTISFTNVLNAPENVAKIEVITKGFSAWSVRGIELSDGETTYPLLLADENFQEPFDYTIVAVHIDYNNGFHIIRDYNSTELYANNAVLQTLRDNNFINNQNVPDLTYSQFKARTIDTLEPDLIDVARFRPSTNAVNENLTPYSKFDDLVTKTFFNPLKIQQINDNPLNFVYTANIYSNPFYTKGLSDDIQNYMKNNLRAGSSLGEDSGEGDAFITLIGEYLTEDRRPTSNNPESLHPFASSLQRILQDAVFYRNGGALDTIHSYYMTSLLKKANYDFTSYKNWFANGYNNQYVIDKRLPDNQTSAPVANFWDVNKESDGVFHLLINTDIYGLGNYARESDNKYIITTPSFANLAKTSVKAHGSPLAPVNAIRIELPASTNYNVPYTIDKDSELFRNKISRLVFNNIPNITARSIKLWVNTNPFIINYYDKDDNLITTDYFDSSLNKSQNLKQRTYL